MQSFAACPDLLWLNSPNSRLASLHCHAASYAVRVCRAGERRGPSWRRAWCGSPRASRNAAAPPTASSTNFTCACSMLRAEFALCAHSLFGELAACRKQARRFVVRHRAARVRDRYYSHQSAILRAARTCSYATGQCTAAPCPGTTLDMWGQCVISDASAGCPAGARSHGIAVASTCTAAMPRLPLLTRERPGSSHCEVSPHQRTLRQQHMRTLRPVQHQHLCVHHSEPGARGRTSAEVTLPRVCFCTAPWRTALAHSRSHPPALLCSVHAVHHARRSGGALRP